MINQVEKDIMLSIVIPSYNTPKKFIEDAIGSIDKQSAINYEIVIIDDGSDSSFHLVLEEVARSSEKVVLITAEHNGVSHARNIGVLASKGEYIAFLDADDALDSHFFKDAMTILSDNQPELVLGGTKEFDHSEDIFERITRPDDMSVLRCNEKDIFDLLRYQIDYNYIFSQIAFFNGSHIGRGQIGGRVIRRDVMEAHLFNTNIGYSEDLLWNIQVMQDCEAVIVSNAQWYWYRNNRNSVSRSYNPDIYEDSLILIDELERILDLNNDSLYSAFVNKIYSCIYCCWKHYLSDIKTDNQSRKNVENRIMYEKPWIYLKDERFKRLCSKKMRLFSILYERNLLFASFRLRDDVDRIIGKKS